MTFGVYLLSILFWVKVTTGVIGLGANLGTLICIVDDAHSKRRLLLPIALVCSTVFMLTPNREDLVGASQTLTTLCTLQAKQCR